MGEKVEKRKKKGACWAAMAVAAGAAAAIGVWSLAVGHFVLLPWVHIRLAGEKTIQVEVFSAFRDPGVEDAYFENTDLTDQVVRTGAVDTEVCGTYELAYTARYGRRAETVRRTVKVVDSTPPELTLTGGEELTVSAERLYQEPGYEARDNYDGDITGRVLVSSEKTEKGMLLTYTARDAAGNETKRTRTVTIRDEVAPELTLEGETHLYLPVGAVYEEAGYSARDDLDGDITDRVQTTGTVDTGSCGTQTICYSVCDNAGNRAEIIRYVTVYPKQGENTVYLTFDDGPSSEVTEQVLDILARNHVKATFFILNYSDDKKPLLERMIREGHTIGIHGYSHDYRTVYTSDDGFMENIERLRQRLREDFGYDTKLFRFPGGSSNTISRDYCDGIMSRVTKRSQQEGWVYFDWNVSSGDAGGNGVPCSNIYHNVVDNLRPGRENVVLMHDTNAKQTTADALEDIIRAAREQGYVFLPITEETTPVHHGVNN